MGSQIWSNDFLFFQQGSWRHLVFSKALGVTSFLVGLLGSPLCRDALLESLVPDSVILLQTIYYGKM